MNTKAKWIAAILTIIIIILGWTATITGIGSFGPIQDKIKLGLDIKGGVYVVMEAQTDAKGEDLKRLMEQTQAVIEERVNQMGLSEPVVTIEGENRVRVELPGAENAEEAIESIGRTAQLQFVTADGKVVLDGGMVENAGVTQDQEKGGFAVSLDFDKEGTAAFADATQRAVSGQIVSTTQGVPGNAIMIVLDDQVISSPIVQSVIANGEAIITAGVTGGFPQDEAVNLAALIRGGSSSRISGGSGYLRADSPNWYRCPGSFCYGRCHRFGRSADSDGCFLSSHGTGSQFSPFVICLDRPMGYGCYEQCPDLAGHSRYHTGHWNGGRCQCHYLFPNQRRNL